LGLEIPENPNYRQLVWLSVSSLRVKRGAENGNFSLISIVVFVLDNPALPASTQPQNCVELRSAGGS